MVELVIEHLAVERGSRTILDDLSLRAVSGDAVLLTGPNGSGKTTLIRTIAGFLSPVSGSIRLVGGDDERDLAAQCHYVGHLNGIKSNLTVAENLSFWDNYLSGKSSSTDGMAPVLERFGLAPLANIPTGYLSAGQKRRAGLARLMLAKRTLWLLDEPTVSLDAASTALLGELVNEHTGAGGIVIAATHLRLGLRNPLTLALGGPSIAFSPGEKAGGEAHS